jgi:hypothetical protein
LIVTYKATQEPSMTSLDGLKFEVVKNIVDWDDQYIQIAQVLTHGRYEVVSLTHTPRNIG